ncbi:MAG: hypothetical protein WBP26_01980 [Candidatus Saccharimonadales bacterium]
MKFNFNQLSVQTAYMVQEGAIAPRGGNFVLPKLGLHEQFNPLEPLEFKGAQRDDIVYFVHHRQTTHPMYVAEVDWRGTGTLFSSNLVHAWPEEYIRPHIREMITRLNPGELNQFGDDVLPLLAHISMESS